MIPDIMKPIKNQLIISRVFIVLYFFYCVSWGNAHSAVFFVPFAIMLFTVIFLHYVSIFNINDSKRMLVRNTPKIIVLALIVFNVALQAYYLYSPRYGKYVSEFTGFKETYDLLTGYPSLAIKEINDKSFYRFDEHIKNFRRNHSMINQLNSTSSFYSISNNIILKFFINDMDLWVRTPQNYNRLDNRAILSALTGIKYFVVNTGSEQYLPYGFDRHIHSSGNYVVYENVNVLPLGYTYNNIIAETEYKAYPAIEKQQSLLQGAMISSTTRVDIPTYNPLFNDVAIPYKIECGKDIEYLNGAFYCKQIIFVCSIKF